MCGSAAVNIVSRRRLRAAFEKLAEAGLKLKPSTCEFFKRQIVYLGHIVLKDGIETS